MGIQAVGLHERLGGASMPLNPTADLPLAAPVVRDPAVHAHDVERFHGVKPDPALAFITEFHLAIQLIPRLAGTHQV